MALTEVEADGKAPIIVQATGNDASHVDNASLPQLDLPLLSVIVVCFNHAPYLGKCLNSILQQTYRKLQIIVVDNASVDQSREVIREFRETLAGDPAAIPLEVIFSQTNEREMGAWLQGFARAKGRYVAFIDGDDWLLPRCLETHIKAHLVSRIAVGFTSVDMLQSAGDEIVVATGKRVSDFVMHRSQPRNFVRMENLAVFNFTPDPSGELQANELHLVMPDIAHEWCWSPNSGLCFRREAVALMLTPRPTLREGADGFLVRGISCLMGGITIDKSLAVYRTHGSNLFTKHPALENILQHEREQCDDLEVKTCEAVLRCFTEQMPKLSQSLELVDVYIDAVHTLSKVALGRICGRYSSYTILFLVEKREAIEKNFGPQVYRRWIRRFAKPRDYLHLILRWRAKRPEH